VCSSVCVNVAVDTGTCPLFPKEDTVLPSPPSTTSSTREEIPLHETENPGKVVQDSVTKARTTTTTHVDDDPSRPQSYSSHPETNGAHVATTNTSSTQECISRHGAWNLKRVRESSVSNAGTTESGHVGVGPIMDVIRYPECTSHVNKQP
jgi:hypothetical protein